jgi:hypothetical protein
MFFPSVPSTPNPSTGTGYITPPSSHGSSANEIAIPPINSAAAAAENSAKGSNKVPWLQNLFFFKQPKVFSVTCEAIDCQLALRKMQDAMREVSLLILYANPDGSLMDITIQGMDAKLQSRLDRDGHTRYRGEVRIVHCEYIDMIELTGGQIVLSRHLFFDEIVGDKSCKVKFKLDFVVCGLIDGHRRLFRVDFIQQQGME